MASSHHRSHAQSTWVSHSGASHGDRSFLLVRERPSLSAPGERLALHGVFDHAMQEHLTLMLPALASSRLPLLLDLRAVSALDEAFLTRLLRVQRELAPVRSISFLLASSGPVMTLVQRLGLEARFGLEPVKRLALKRTAVSTPAPAFCVSKPLDEKPINREYIASQSN